MLERITIDLHGGKEHKRNITLSARNNTLQKTPNHKKSGKKETILKTSRRKALPNNKETNSMAP